MKRVLKCKICNQSFKNPTLRGAKMAIVTCDECRHNMISDKTHRRMKREAAKAEAAAKAEKITKKIRKDVAAKPQKKPQKKTRKVIKRKKITTTKPKVKTSKTYTTLSDFIK